MTTTAKVLGYLEENVPSRWAEAWDNPGLQVGDPLASVDGIAVALDVTERSLELAYEANCNLVVTHHPLIFQPLQRLTLNSPEGRVISRAICKGIGIISLHTNWDASPEGVNVALARALDLKDTEPLERRSEKDSDGSWGMGASGELPDGLPLDRLARSLQDKWGVSWVKVYGDMNRQVRKIALCGGSGASLIPPALEKGADVFVTADVKYHQIQQALQNNLALCIVDHGEMEAVSLESLAATISRGTGLPVQVLEDRALPAPSFLLSPSLGS